MKLTREEALSYHRQMWKDMQDKLGNCPTPYQRHNYKKEWCKKHFPREHITNHCFLCEYISYRYGRAECWCCPIKWPKHYCEYNGYYLTAPISEILKLPEQNSSIWKRICEHLI